MAAVAKNYGLSALPLCGDASAVGSAVDLDALGETNSHGRVDPFILRAYGEAATDGGFDPCSVPVVFGSVAFDPNESYFAYAVTNATAGIGGELPKSGYTQTTNGPATIFSRGADHQITSDKYFSALDRIAVLPGWVVTAAATSLVDTALSAYGGLSPATRDDSVEHQLLVALGDFDAVVIVGTKITDPATVRAFRRAIPVQLPPSWGALSSPDRVALSWRHSADGSGAIKFALYYKDSARSAQDASEFANRLRSYRALLNHNALCSAADARASGSGASTMIIATCTAPDEITLQGLVVGQDLTLLLSNGG